MKTSDSQCNPGPNTPIFVRSRVIWRGIHEVTFRFAGSNRHHHELFRRIGDQWTSGEAFPTGVRSSPLRTATPDIAAGLDIAQPNSQPQ